MKDFVLLFQRESKSMPKSGNTRSRPPSNKVRAFESHILSSVKKVVRDLKGAPLDDEDGLGRISRHIGSSPSELIPYEVVIARFLSQEGYS